MTYTLSDYFGGGATTGNDGVNHTIFVQAMYAVNKLYRNCS